MMENALAIANFFIQKSLETGVPITNMKLVKLVYIAHGWYLGLTGQPLLNEAVEAWKYGPVVPSVYHTFKEYGGAPISKIATYPNELGHTGEYALSGPELIPFLNKIWEVYGNHSGVDLSAMTHQNDTPWQKVWESKGWLSRSEAIPDNVIKQYYENLVHVPESA